MCIGVGTNERPRASKPNSAAVGTYRLQSIFMPSGDSLWCPRLGSVSGMRDFRSVAGQGGVLVLCVEGAGVRGQTGLEEMEGRSVFHSVRLALGAVVHFRTAYARSSSQMGGKGSMESGSGSTSGEGEPGAGPVEKPVRVGPGGEEVVGERGRGYRGGRERGRCVYKRRGRRRGEGGDWCMREES